MFLNFKRHRKRKREEVVYRASSKLIYRERKLLVQQSTIKTQGRGKKLVKELIGAS